MVVTEGFVFSERCRAASVQLHKSVLDQESRLHLILSSLCRLSSCLGKPSKKGLDSGLVFVSKYLLGIPLTPMCWQPKIPYHDETQASSQAATMAIFLKCFPNTKEWNDRIIQPEQDPKLSKSPTEHLVPWSQPASSHPPQQPYSTTHNCAWSKARNHPEDSAAA